MKWFMKSCAARSEKFHNKVRVDIENCRCSTTANTNCRDLQELLNIVTDQESAYIEQVLLMLSKEYFEFLDMSDPKL